MNGPLWIAAGLLVVATYLATLLHALQSFSRSRLERRMNGRAAAAGWLNDQREIALHIVSFLLYASRIGCVMFVVVGVVGVGNTLSWGVLGYSVAVTALLLWIGAWVVSIAISRHFAEGFLTRNMLVVRAITTVGRPIASCAGLLEEAVARLTGANLREDDDREAELLLSIEDTQREGGLDEQAAEIIENVVEFSSTDVGAVMTPRTDIEGIDVTATLPEIREFVAKAGHSRIPVFRENLDSILGILYVKDLIAYLGEEASNFELEPILRQPIVVPNTKPVRELLAHFQQAEVHMAIVVDEYGGTAGLVTIEDVLEEIVGEIHDEHEPDDEEEPGLDMIDETLAEVDARFHINDLNTLMGLDLPEDDEFDTIGGFMLARLGRVPEAGESFEDGGARFTALAATPTHVERVKVELLDPESANGQRA